MFFQSYKDPFRVFMINLTRMTIFSEMGGGDK